jgi:hypothetical protein
LKSHKRKANLIATEILELRQISLCCFVSFVANKFSCGGLPSNAALCRSRPISPGGKIALLVETNDYDPNGGTL